VQGALLKSKGIFFPANGGWRVRMKRAAIFLLLLLIFFAGSAYAAEVKNVVAKQVGNRILFEYELIGDERESEVSVTITIKGQTYPSDKLHLEGDFGKVRTGNGKKIWWNVLQDFPRGYAGDLQWEVVAGGGKFTDSVTGMEFVFIKGGCFEMGDTFGDGDKVEKPVHEVCVDDFYLGKYEVTVGEFRKFVDATGYSTEAEKGDGCNKWTGKKWEKDRSASWRSPGFPINDKHPVVCVSWNDAVAYARWMEGRGGKAYRLPTEAEWEYAARDGGKKIKYSWGNGKPSGNIADESAKRKFPQFNIWAGYDDGYVYTAPVGSFRPNGLGLYDMTGNVWECCADWYDENYYEKSPKDNPRGPGNGQYRVFRGGSWGGFPREVGAAHRVWDVPAARYYCGGVRLGLSAR